MNIKKIIRESLFDNFDWLDTDIDFKGQDLYKFIQDYFKEYYNQYWLEVSYAPSDDGAEILIKDNTGSYFMINYRKFNIPYLVKEFEETINGSILKDDPGTREEYIRLAKALEPIIGPIRIT